MQILILHNQSFLDIALQHTGTAESLFDIALTNGLSLTDDLLAGTSLSLGENIFIEKDILSYYKAKKIQPATAFSMEDKQTFEKQEGISIWAINLDFVVLP